jgi:hypothetical protein
MVAAYRGNMDLMKTLMDLGGNELLMQADGVSPSISLIPKQTLTVY